MGEIEEKVIENEISPEEKNEDELKEAKVKKIIEKVIDERIIQEKEAEAKRIENNQILKEKTDKIIEERKKEDKQKIQDEIIKVEEEEAKEIERYRLIQEKIDKEKEDRIKKEKQEFQDEINRNKELQEQRNTEQSQYREKTMELHLIEYCEEHSKDYWYCTKCIDPPIMLDIELLAKYDWVVSLKDNLFSNITKIKNSFKIESKDLYCPQCNYTERITFIKMYHEVKRLQTLIFLQNEKMIIMSKSIITIKNKVKNLMLNKKEVKDHTKI